MQQKIFIFFHRVKKNEIKITFISSFRGESIKVKCVDISSFKITRSFNLDFRDLRSIVSYKVSPLQDNVILIHAQSIDKRYKFYLAKISDEQILFYRPLSSCGSIPVGSLDTSSLFSQTDLKFFLCDKEISCYKYKILPDLEKFLFYQISFGREFLAQEEDNLKPIAYSKDLKNLVVFSGYKLYLFSNSENYAVLYDLLLGIEDSKEFIASLSLIDKTLKLLSLGSRNLLEDKLNDLIFLINNCHIQSDILSLCNKLIKSFLPYSLSKKFRNNSLRKRSLSEKRLNDLLCINKRLFPQHRKRNIEIEEIEEIEEIKRLKREIEETEDYI